MAEISWKNSIGFCCDKSGHPISQTELGICDNLTYSYCPMHFKALKTDGLNLFIAYFGDNICTDSIVWLSILHSENTFFLTL